MAQSTLLAGTPGEIWQQLASIQIGGAKNGQPTLKPREKIFIFRNIATLVENGLPLPKALETLIQERSLSRFAPMLGNIRQKVAGGDTFSAGLSLYPETFGEMFINQIKVGERSGTLPATIERIVYQLEHADNLKNQIIKKLTYPAILCVAGGASVAFMITFVVPTFEKTYQEAGAKLPAITEFLINCGWFAQHYGWFIVLVVMGLVLSLVFSRRHQRIRFWMDQQLLRVPILGDTLKNIAVLQFMEVLGNLMESGFTIVEALHSCARSINNLAVRRSVEQLHSAVLRGERFSQELERHDDLFPPIVKQLTIVGEKTGTLSKCTEHIRAHLRREVERTLSIMVGAIEPIMTLGLAAAIGTILLAIYLPMFDMIGTMGETPN
ncbi:MAG: type II secretion system F family protein [Pirellulales bacterium]|nr:type II secretion system F family protein [Pirellulales bacterium]